MKYVLTLILLCIQLQTQAPNKPHYKDTPKVNYTQYLRTLIEQHEGRLYKPYVCPAGYNTVGIGHIILQTDRFTYPLSDTQIDSIFERDITKCVNVVKHDFPLIKEHKVYALAYFIYAHGNTYYKSQLRQLVSNSIPIGVEVHKYIYYRKTGDTTYTKHKLLIRIADDIERIYNNQVETGVGY